MKMRTKVDKKPLFRLKPTSGTLPQFDWIGTEYIEVERGDLFLPGQIINIQTSFSTLT